MLCIYGLLYLGQGNCGWCPRWASTDDIYDTEMGAMKAKGQARLELPRKPGYKSTGFCMCGTERRVQSALGRRG